jgi:hypothetical protein
VPDQVVGDLAEVLAHVDGVGELGEGVLVVVALDRADEVVELDVGR